MSVDTAGIDTVNRAAPQMRAQRSSSMQHWPKSRFTGPRIIGHRGACFHAVENTLASFALASTLGADMWELDVRVTQDGICVVSHDDDISTVFTELEAKKLPSTLISALSFQQLSTINETSCADVPRLEDVILLAKELKAGLYIELKDARAGIRVIEQLQTHQLEYAVIGSFEVSWLTALSELNCPYPIAVLIPVGVDPFDRAAAANADIIHLCWERADDAPQHLVTPSLLAQAKKLQLEVVLWHEERIKVIKALMRLPVMGVCSDRPELMVPYPGSAARNSAGPVRPQVVCHRGAESIAPENTIAAVTRAFEQGLGWVEIDVQQTSDGELIVLHDSTLQRTTNGVGNACDHTWAQVQALDAGSHFNRCYRGEKVPLLSEVITVAKHFNKSLYVEIKEANAAKVLAQVKSQYFMPDCFFWSFDVEKLLQIRALDKHANLMARSQDFATIAEAVGCFDANVIEIEMTALSIAQGIEQDIADVRALNCSVMLCYQGNDPRVFQQIYSLKPDLLNLKRPDIWKQIVFQHNAAG